MKPDSEFFARSRRKDHSMPEIWKKTYREYQRNSTSDRFRSVQVRFRTQEQILFVIGGFPRDDGGAKEQNLHRLPRRQTCSDARIVLGDGDLRCWNDRRHRNGGGFLGTLHLFDILFYSSLTILPRRETMGTMGSARTQLRRM